MDSDLYWGLVVDGLGLVGRFRYSFVTSTMRQRNGLFGLRESNCHPLLPVEPLKVEAIPLSALPKDTTSNGYGLVGYHADSHTVFFI